MGRRLISHGGSLEALPSVLLRHGGLLARLDVFCHELVGSHAFRDVLQDGLQGWRHAAAAVAFLSRVAVCRIAGRQSYHAVVVPHDKVARPDDLVRALRVVVHEDLERHVDADHLDDGLVGRGAQAVREDVPVQRAVLVDVPDAAKHHGTFALEVVCPGGHQPAVERVVDLGERVVWHLERLGGADHQHAVFWQSVDVAALDLRTGIVIRCKQHGVRKTNHWWSHCL